MIARLGFPKFAGLFASDRPQLSYLIIVRLSFVFSSVVNASSDAKNASSTGKVTVTAATSVAVVTVGDADGDGLSTCYGIRVAVGSVTQDAPPIDNAAQG